MSQRRIEQLALRAQTRGSMLGRRVTVDGAIGRIDAEFIDLQAAIDVGLIDDGWFAEQNGRDLTTREERWFSVVLPDGAVLVGTHELHLDPNPL